MPDYNRISAELSDVTVAEVLDLIQQLRAKLPFTVTLTTQARRELAKLGERSIGFDEKCSAYHASHPEFMPGYIALDEVAKDRALRKQLLKIAPALDAFAAEFDDSVVQVSSEIYQADLAYYQSVKEARKRGVPGAEDIYNDLSSRFSGQGGGNGNSSGGGTNPPATSAAK